MLVGVRTLYLLIRTLSPPPRLTFPCLRPKKAILSMKLSSIVYKRTHASHVHIGGEFWHKEEREDMTQARPPLLFPKGPYFGVNCRVVLFLNTKALNIIHLRSNLKHNLPNTTAKINEFHVGGNGCLLHNLRHCRGGKLAINLNAFWQQHTQDVGVRTRHSGHTHTTRQPLPLQTSLCSALAWQDR